MRPSDPQQNGNNNGLTLWQTYLKVAGDRLPAPLLFIVLILILLFIRGFEVVELEGEVFYFLLALPILGLIFWAWHVSQQAKHEIQLRELELREKELDQRPAEKKDKPKPEEDEAEPPPPPEPASEAELERRYLERLAGRCEWLPMEAIDKSATRPDAARVALNRVFTQVDVPQRIEAETDADAAEAMAARQRDPEEERRPAVAAIGDRETPYLVLLGKPGSGKSTLVDYVALCLAGTELGRPGDPTLDDLEKQEWALRWRLPVRVILREYAEEGLQHGRSLWEFIAAELAKPDAKGADLAAYAPYLRTHLQNRGGLLLLDGLDEVPDAHRWRERLREEIRNFAAAFGRARILVTGRPYAYDKPEWQLPDFAQTELLDFNQEQMFAYVDRRYQLMAGGAGLERGQAEDYAEELKRQIEERKALRELAARPLLLALITSLHHWRGGRTLPQDREKLYDESVDLLIDLWQRRKRLPDVDPNDAEAHELTRLLGVGPVELRDALSKVAFEVHRDQPTPQGTANVPAAKLAGALHEVIDPDQVAPQQIIDYVRNRAGLLEEREAPARGKEIYAFAHRTFQEYLAGCYLLTQDNFADEAAKLARLDPERWREALLLAARRDKNPGPAWDLVDALCQPETAPRPDDDVAEEAWWGAFLAGQVLGERELWRNPPRRRRKWVRRVRGWLAALLAAGALPPRDRARAGRMLAQLGDPRPGVGVVERDGVKLPDILWSAEIPAGMYTVGGTYGFDVGEISIDRPYRLACYPVTNAQFQCFIKAPDRDRAEWWRGLPEDERQFSEPRFPHANHPRETVSWYQAVAFCRWLTARLHAGDLPRGPLAGDLTQYTITLPHEYEWEVAARWPNDGMEERIYPWGAEFDAAKANTDEGGIGSTTAVGLYPSGKNPALDLYDLSGNVWEWCRNRYETPDEDVDPEDVDTDDARRVLRGGSWSLTDYFARSACRDGLTPDGRYAIVGGRVCVVRRPPSHGAH